MAPQRKSPASPTYREVQALLRQGESQSLLDEMMEDRTCRLVGCTRDRSFGKCSDLRRHWLKHIVDKKDLMVKCTRCGYQDAQRINVKNHERSFHDRVRIPCTNPPCDKDFSSPSCLSRHLRSGCLYGKSQPSGITKSKRRLPVRSLAKKTRNNLIASYTPHDSRRDMSPLTPLPDTPPFANTTAMPSTSSSPPTHDMSPPPLYLPSPRLSPCSWSSPPSQDSSGVGTPFPEPYVLHMDYPSAKYDLHLPELTHDTRDEGVRVPHEYDDLSPELKVPESFSFCASGTGFYDPYTSHSVLPSHWGGWLPQQGYAAGPASATLDWA